MANKIVKFFIFLPFIILSKGIGLAKFLQVARQPVIFKARHDKLIEIHSNTTIGNRRSPNYLYYSYLDVRDRSRGIYIGANTKIGNAISIVSDEEIVIGSNCLIGNNVKIYDSDFHSLCLARTSNNCKREKVLIDDSVFIGDNVIILKGVNIGYGSIIGAGSVVLKDVEPNSIVAGNPATEIRKIDDF
ncbi:acyltransferase [Vibrio cholerae]|nr:acyltransferase [Vibrio cholerae]ELJ8716835.1 acyltransferase [Vibrio cholerae]